MSSRCITLVRTLAFLRICGIIGKANGQITVLGVKVGDDIMVNKNKDEIVKQNASLDALLVAQKECEAVAEELGVSSLNEVVDMLKEVRKESEASLDKDYD